MRDLLLCWCFLFSFIGVIPLMQGQNDTKKEKKEKKEKKPFIFQGVQGHIFDKMTKAPISGAQVELTYYVLKVRQLVSYKKTTTTDSKGLFFIDSIPAGRHHIQVSAEGYWSAELPSFLVTSARNGEIEMGLDIFFQNPKDSPEFVQQHLLDITRESSDAFAIGPNYTINPSETSILAGKLNDPMRSAASLPGNYAVDDYRNLIVTRGNNPHGATTFLEGMPIETPNHFSPLGVAGSALSLLNNNTLENTQVMTSAFSAEYGNAYSSVSAFRIRKGNNRQYNFGLQYGINGAEAIFEGPFKKGGASFLLDYRYAYWPTFGFLNIDKFPTTIQNLPQVQDLTLKISTPLPKGEFSFFALGGLSSMDLIGNVIRPNDSWSRRAINNKIQSVNGTAGINYLQFIGSASKTHIEITAGASYINYTENQDSVYQTPSGIDSLVLDYTKRQRQIIPNLAIILNSEFHKRVHFRMGLRGQLYNLNVADTDISTGRVDRFYNGNIIHGEAFMQFRYQIIRQLTMQVGVYGHYYTLNNDFGVEPRFSLSWRPGGSHLFRVSYGWHSKHIPLSTALLQFDTPTGTLQPNLSLGFIDNQQADISYTLNMPKSWTVSLSAYGQYLTNIPIYDTTNVNFPRDSAFSFSLINDLYYLGTPPLIALQSTGIAYTYGGEFSIAKAFRKGYFLRINAHIFDSKYRAADGIFRNTVFNTQYSVNAVISREFKLGKRAKNAMNVDLRATTYGGQPYIPIDPIPSAQSGLAIYRYEAAYLNRARAYFRMDIKWGFRFNDPRHKISHYFYLEVLNLFDSKNRLDTFFNPTNRLIQHTQQTRQLLTFAYQFHF